MTRSEKGTALALMMLFVARLALVNYLVPPWQHPDEPQHVFATMLSMPSVSEDPVGSARVESEIVGSMVEHGWWPHLGWPDPDPVPTTFDEGPAKVAGVYGPAGGSQLYYRLCALVADALSLQSVTDVLSLMRTLSVALGLLAWWPVVEGARLFAGRRMALWVAAAFALQPQFALVAAAASPDALVNACGALLFLCLARVVTRHGGLRTALVAMAAGVMATLTRRLGLPLLMASAFVAVLGMAGGLRRRLSSPFGLRAWGGLSLLLGGVLLIGFTERQDLAAVWAYAQRLLRENTVTIDDPLGYVLSLFDSAWLNAGWLTYPAPAAWRLLLRGMVLLCVLALPVALLREAPLRRAVIACGLLVGLQVAAVYFSYYRVGLGAQGRYLLPVLAPWLLLVGLGAEQWRVMTRVPVPLLAIGVMVGLDLVFFTQVLVPAYGR